MDLQFYPSSPRLADKAWSKFTQKHVDRLLDACAGEGALAEASPEFQRWKNHYRREAFERIDVIEYDPNKHPLLREKGFKVVGFDLFDFKGFEIYSHVILNPPFKHGCSMVLRIFDGLWEGEIVAILNAETVRNQCNSERVRLGSLIERYGDVEFEKEAFLGDDVQRQTPVEIAIVHLKKSSEIGANPISPLIESLSKDNQHHEDYDACPQGELMLPRSFLECQCEAFDLAVNALREQVKVTVAAQRLGGRLGATLQQINQRENGQEEKASPLGVDARAAFSAGYHELKNRAWTSILRSLDVTSKLSASVQRATEARFKEICELEFSLQNVRAFLAGLGQSVGDLRVQAALDVFDQITRHAETNTSHYMPYQWKSNTKHMTCGRRIKLTRFILPGFAREGYHRELGWSELQRLGDFDKVFSYLDGKEKAEFGLADLFKAEFGKLRAGSRMRSDYFEVRYYPQVGTIHFFPTSRALIEKFNKLVGVHRKWLPPTPEEGTQKFWQAYKNADKLDPEYRKAALDAQKAVERITRWTRNPFDSQADSDNGMNPVIENSMKTVLRKHNLLDEIQHEAQEIPLLT